MNRTARRQRRLFAAIGILGATALSACAGENLFTLQVATGAGGPEVTITTPTDGSTVGLNSSLGVGFDVTAADGAASYSVAGRYVGQETAAYRSTSESVSGIEFSVFATLSPAAGQTTGEVYVVVEVLDAGGDSGKDSVKVTITN